jgi:hypothetical protein
MNNPTIFVDLDRTIFDTNRFFPIVWQAVGDLYPGVHVEQEIGLIDRWYETSVGDLRTYYFEKHFEAVTGVKFEDGFAVLHEHLKGGDYAFPDAQVVNSWGELGYNVRILSFGGRGFQELKLSLIPEFDQPRDIILERKGAFIARHYPGAHGFMIDDKRNPGLPGGVQEVWLNRANPGPVTHEGDTVIISSLEQMQEIL